MRDDRGTGGVDRARVRRVLAIGTALAVSAAALAGIGSTAGPAAADDLRAQAASTTTAPAPRPTKVTVTRVTASSATGSSRTTVSTAVTVTNRTTAREPAATAWVYLAAGKAQYALWPVPVPALAAGATTTVRTTHWAPARVPGGTYSVVACAGAYSTQRCRTSASTVTTKAAPRPRAETGVMLDVARAYYPVPVIEGYIDVLAADGGDYLHLHLSDDQNVGIESAVLGQTTANATLTDGVWTSDVTGRPFLSAVQAQEIAAYAAQRGIAIVPEFDTPGHMAAAFELLEALHGERWVDRIRAGESELDPSAPQSAALAARIYAELTQTFPASRTVHIGGDEWGSDVSADRRVAWLDAVAATLGDRTVWAWNDGIDRSAVARLDPRIDITYWSVDGDTEDPAERAERRQQRARATDLYAAGTELLNYNSYYLYEVPTDLDQADMDYTVTDLRENWSLRTWDSDTGKRLRGPAAGAAVAIWGEDLQRPPSEDLLRWSTPHIEAMIETARS